MEDFYTEEFREFYGSLTNFQKKAIEWCSVSNHECPRDFYQLVFDSVESTNTHMTKQLKRSITDNYCSILWILDKPELKTFDEDEKVYLKEKFSQLDGTLLMDVIYCSLKSHKIFI
jgi:hypothetical protein